ncbi:MAG: GHKL domain-containing protein [Clostridia bacterium]|nr:GHKL domain-containing protein [Clostridia bacterium]
MIVECISFLSKDILGITLVLFILNKLIGYEIKIKKIATIIFSVGLLAMTILPYFLVDNPADRLMYVDYASVFCFAVYPYFILKPTKKKIFFLCGFIINVILDIVVSIIYTTAKIINFSIENAIYCGVIVLLLVIFCLIYYKRNFIVPKEFFERIPTFFYFVIVAAAFATQYVLEFSRTDTSFVELAQALLVVASGLTVICLSYIIFKYINASLKERDSLEQLDRQLAHYEELAEKNQDIRRFRHDIKNNLYMLNILLEDGKYDEAKEHLEKLSLDIKETENKYATGNYFADALISHKAAEAAESNISIRFAGSIPSRQISNSDLCTILANSLDNAIRACKDISPCEITITSILNDKGCTITISNPVKKKVEIKNNTIRTTKNDSVNHGLGIGNIKRTVQKNNGVVTLSCTDTVFSIKVALLF